MQKSIGYKEFSKALKKVVVDVFSLVGPSASIINSIDNVSYSNLKNLNV